ncbi:MAG: hypothetical protein R6X06_00365 [Gammaproteobacteria bacterium]
MVLALSGIQDMLQQELYPRLRGLGNPPALEGWPVFLFGAAQLALGIFLLYRTLRRH